MILRQSYTTMQQYIAYIWKYGDKTAMLSRDDESFEDFKKRVYSCYPDYTVQFSEFNEIY